ncbi:hypothetical protein FHP25_11200 [Vineibacter terrae]|uniref:Uncharacterized protein n=1 Tax=Vineibacter terrae TaxID=2586908 RepID=A0A5C8PPD7_9HYPH|nr:hypothetical protein [Vineibacter terrae]TXL76751.1 hypothetical protein FHP25_11200 [Vineibacter terrae]
MDGHDTASTQPEGHGRTLKARAIDEVRRFVILFIYLWILFGLFVLNERIVLQQRQIDFAAHGFAVINALVLAKVMLVAEDLNLGHWLDRRPLIYPILQDSLLFALLFIGFHVVEHVIIGLFKGEALKASVPYIGGGGWAGVLCVAVIFFFALMPYFALRNINRALGPGRLGALLFGTGAGAQPDR